MFFSVTFANTISLQRCKKSYLNITKIPKKYFIKIYKKAPFDKNPHYYTGISIKNLVKIIGNAKKLTFIAYDDYKVTFNKKEINTPYILFIFLKNNKPIPLSQRGPAEVIYNKKDTEKNYFFKSIFLIKRIICEK